ncbi:MAG TPA: PQQ-dependent sugar dehydrogenase [Nocardioidaceae bacterium]|nr:PQQ-dependent sugar dehydrogenase [Nocardioidaceae bacterium]
MTGPTTRLLLGALGLLACALATACSAPQGDPDGLGATHAGPQPTTRTGAPHSPSAGAPTAPSTGPSTGPGTGPTTGPTNGRPLSPHVVGTVAHDLAAPWGVDFLPDGTALVTERDTTRILAVRDGRSTVVGQLDAAAPQGESGVLGLAVSPGFAEDRWVYVYVSTDHDNRVVRMRYDGRRLGPPRVVLDAIPRGFIHDGGRLEFGPDGMLFVSTGETGEESLAQDRDSLAGKILRITPDGQAAPDNPVPGSPVWTMGHRNVQGLAFDAAGRLWASEFGQDTWDELNRIERGRNYGWPLVEGRGDLAEYRNPFAQWRTSEASPSGLAFAEGALWMASLRGERLWRVPVHPDGSIGQPQDFFVGDFGRLRTVVVAPDGHLWLTTSNRDGRGSPAPADDRILEVALR